LKIIQLQAENIKCLSAVEINPDGNVVVISGNNGAGKSSVLDSIYWALSGAKNIQDKPIRDGETEARIRLNLGEIIVTRKFTASGTQLVVTSAEGAQFPSPQRMLDELVGAITFDPLEFSRMAPKDQVKVLRDLASLEIDFDDVEMKNKADYDKRTSVNREIKELEAWLKATEPSVAGLKSLEKLDLAELAEKYSNAKALVAEAASIERDFERATADIEACDKTIIKLQEQLTNEKKRYVELQEAARAIADKGAKVNPPSEEKLQAMQDYISKAESHNKKIDLAHELSQKREQLENLTSVTSELTARMDQRTDAARAAVAAAQMPVDGLSLTADGVTYNGIPFGQINTAEKLKVSVAVAMASNPQLRVIRVENGCFLDDDGMAILRQMAAENDFQIWVERVGAEEMSVVIDDGTVVTGKSEAGSQKPE